MFSPIAICVKTTSARHAAKDLRCTLKNVMIVFVILCQMMMMMMNKKTHLFAKSFTIIIMPNVTVSASMTILFAAQIAIGAKTGVN